MTYWLHDDEMDEYKIYSAAEAAYDAMWVEVVQLSQPVRIHFRGECTLIKEYRDGPVFEGDPRLDWTSGTFNEEPPF